MGNTTAFDDPNYDDGKDLNDSACSVVGKKLKKLSEARGVGIRCLILIENKCDYDLKLKNHGGSQSFFYTDIEHAFKDRKIKGGHTGGAIMIRNSGIPISSVVGAEYCLGYVSFTVATNGRNYVVVLGWHRVQWGRNAAGIAIRGEDGKSDEFGNINGHAVDPTGTVTDLNRLCSTVFSVASKKQHTFHESCSEIIVECSFPDGHHPDDPFLWKFTVKNVREKTTTATSTAVNTALPSTTVP